MPSFLHEALVELFRTCPELVVHLVSYQSSPRLPSHDQVVADSASLGAAVAPELAADGLLRLEQEGRTVLSVVLEVQLSIDLRKHFSWPSYLVAARARHRCDAMLLVVTPYAHVAEWARRPMELGPNSGFVTATVIGPEQMPAVLNMDDALRLPELAVLSAVSHGHDDDARHAAALAATAIAAAFSLRDHRAEIYYDIIMAAQSDAAREALAMTIENYQFQDEGLRRAWADGEAMGLSKGEAMGLSKGEAMGVSKGLGEALLDTLEARGFQATQADVARIRACTDADLLRRWHRRALTAGSVPDVFQ